MTTPTYHLADFEYHSGSYSSALSLYSQYLSSTSSQNESASSPSLSLCRLSAMSMRLRCHVHLKAWGKALQDGRSFKSALEEVASSPSLEPASAPLLAAWSEDLSYNLGLSYFNLEEYEASSAALLSAIQQSEQKDVSSMTPEEQARHTGYVRKCATLRRKCDAEIEDGNKQQQQQREGQQGKAGSAKADGAPVPPPAQPAAKPAAKQGGVTTAANFLPPKYYYSNSDKFITVTLLEENLSSDSLTLTLTPTTVHVQVSRVGVPELITVLKGTLYGDVLVDECKTNFKQAKTDVKLRKASSGEWHELLAAAPRAEKEKEKEAQTEEEEEAAAAAAAAGDADPMTASAAILAAPPPTVEKTKPRPYSSTKDWDAIDKNLKEAEAAEKPEGEEALNKLFKDIYGKANEDTRRAMIKSFQTSGGTVLSTNWDEVKKKDYESSEERQAPNGMVWKNWEGDKLKQKEDK